MTAATTTLDIKPRQKWHTVTGRTVQILNTHGIHGYQFSALYLDKDRSLTHFTAAGVSIGRDDLVEMVEDAPAPKPVATPSTDAYRRAAIEDELALATLLGWRNLPSVESGMNGRWMFGTHHEANGHTVRGASVPMPAWRREWHAAGQLIAHCTLSINTSAAGVAVSALTGPVFRANYEDHPTPDDAIRFAMCKAALAYLGAPP